MAAKTDTLNSHAASSTPEYTSRQAYAACSSGLAVTICAAQVRLKQTTLQAARDGVNVLSNQAVSAARSRVETG